MLKEAASQATETGEPTLVQINPNVWKVLFPVRGRVLIIGTIRYVQPGDGRPPYYQGWIRDTWGEPTEPVLDLDLAREYLFDQWLTRLEDKS